MLKKSILKLMVPYFWVRKRRRYKRKINKIRKALVYSQDKKYNTQVLSFYKKFGIHIDTTWHHLYAVANGLKHVEYIPENLFYHKIEPQMTLSDFQPIFSNKSAFHRFLNIDSCDYLYKIKGRLYDSDFCAIVNLELIEDEDYIIKDITGSQGGSGIEKVAGIKELKKSILNRDNVVIQKNIIQHTDLMRLNDSSLNTIRIMTLSLADQVYVLSSVLRIGKSGAIVDNFSSGGYTIGIDHLGQTKTNLFDSAFKSYKDYKPDNGELVSGIKIPKFNEILSLLDQLHKKIPFFGLISWDVTVDVNENIIVLEMNVKEQGINIHQLCNGPLFGELTEKVLKNSL